MGKLTRTFPHPVSSTYRCEICGKEISDVDVCCYLGGMSHPGKNGVVGSFGCPAENHYGCCEAHAWEAFVACHDEHLKPIHAALHAQVEADPDKMAQVERLRCTQHQRPAWQLVSSLPAATA